MSAIRKTQWLNLDDNDLLIVLDKYGFVKGAMMLNSKGELARATYDHHVGGWVDADEFEITKGEDGWYQTKGKVLC